MYFTARTAETVLFVFLTHHVQAEQDPAQEFTENCGPSAADEVQLVEEGVRMAEGRLPQEINE